MIPFVPAIREVHDGWHDLVWWPGVRTERQLDHHRPPVERPAADHQRPGAANEPAKPGRGPECHQQQDVDASERDLAADAPEYLDGEVGHRDQPYRCPARPECN